MCYWNLINRKPKQLFQVKLPFAMTANYVEIHCCQYPIWICGHIIENTFTPLVKIYYSGKKLVLARTRSLNSKERQ